MTPFLEAKLPRSWTASEPRRGWHRGLELANSFAYCRDVTRRHAKSFYFSSFPLPEEKKLAAFAVYAFCRHVDDIIDESADCGTGGTEEEAPTREILHDSLLDIEGGRSRLPFAAAFAEVNRQYGIERPLYLDLIEGCCRDREPVKIGTFAELEEYCYYVASVVGLMMSKIFGLREPEGVPYAVDMGIAMQLTNILRDVEEDYAMGRIYLPAEELEAYGLSEDDFRNPGDQERWVPFIRMQVERARDYYRRGCAGLKYLENDGSRKTATLMARVYAGILDVLAERDYRVFGGRAYVPTLRKIRIALRTTFER